MIGQYLITFREVFEAALITAIILSYLYKTNRHRLSRYVWYGVSIALVTSLAIGLSIWFLYGSIPKSVQTLFEGSAALLAVIVLTSMIFWMATKGKVIKMEIERHIEVITTRGMLFGLTAFSFIVVFREGLETVLFLTPFMVNDAIPTLIGLILGTGSALVLSFVIFVLGMKIDIRKFFYFTSILLILLAAGLFGYGVHELIEYFESQGIDIGWLGKAAYDLGIPKDSVFHHKGIVGSIFAVMFGYTVKAEWARVIVHVTYLAIFLPLILWIYRKPATQSK